VLAQDLRAALAVGVAEGALLGALDRVEHLVDPRTLIRRPLCVPRGEVGCRPLGR